MKLNVDLIYPVGSIYMNYNNPTNPSVLFGGTWEAIPYRYLVGVGRIKPNSNNAVGSVDDYASAGYTVAPEESFGEIFHTLTENEIPKHYHWGSPLGLNMMTTAYQNGDNIYLATGYNGFTGVTGGGASHNNLPPSLAVYMWRRTA